MYDRASREFGRPLNSTLETVGPGSYELYGFLQGKNRVGYAPFGSMTGRETFVDVADQTMAAPGPGQYDPLLSTKDRVKGGHSLSNKSRRFEESREKNPGPGSYNLSKKSDWVKVQPLKPISHEESIAGKHLVFVRKVDPPSIPSPGKAYGYEEANDGSLKPQIMPDQDISMGPAYYNVDHRDTQTTRAYKGVFFGKKGARKCQAIAAQKNDIPGPGAYNPFEPEEIKTPLDLILEENNKRFFEAKIPRYHELIAKEQEKKAVPAPDHYQIKSQFNDKTVAPQNEHTALVAPFGSQARRFGDSSNHFPAPCSYNDPRTAFESLKRIKGVKGSPFGQTSIRFGSKERKSQPGPGSYNIPDEVTSMIKKNILTTKKKVAFGSSSVRTAPIARAHEDLYPGPAHYTNIDNPPKNADVQPSSTFASMTERLHSPATTVKEVPPPGSYEVRKSYDTTQGRVLYPYSQKTNRNSQKRGAFLSSSSRFKASTDPQPKRENTPGPGQYNLPDEGHSVQGGLMVTKDLRFKPQKSEVPGPGNYELSPQFAHSVLKGTFNATLSNPMTKSSYEEAAKTSCDTTQHITLTSN